jgi:hypothetical protein
VERQKDTRGSTYLIDAWQLEAKARKIPREGSGDVDRNASQEEKAPEGWMEFVCGFAELLVMEWRGKLQAFSLY